MKYDMKLMRNADGYYDPTAGEALKNAERKMPNGYIRWLGQPIYICSTHPIRTDADIRYLERCCTFAAGQGAHPIAPYLFYADIYDLTDEAERGRILTWTRSWLRQASEIWVFDGEPPRQLNVELQRCVRRGKTIRFFSADMTGKFQQEREISNTPPVRSGENDAEGGGANGHS